VLIPVKLKPSVFKVFDLANPKVPTLGTLSFRLTNIAIARSILYKLMSYVLFIIITFVFDNKSYLFFLIILTALNALPSELKS
jgi:hypothetical protein